MELKNLEHNTITHCRLPYTVARGLLTQESWLWCSYWSYKELLLQTWHITGNRHKQRKSIQASAIQRIHAQMEDSPYLEQTKQSRVERYARKYCEDSKKAIQKMPPVKPGHPKKTVNAQEQSTKIWKITCMMARAGRYQVGPQQMDSLQINECQSRTSAWESGHERAIYLTWWSLRNHKLSEWIMGTYFAETNVTSARYTTPLRIEKIEEMLE